MIVALNNKSNLKKDEFEEYKNNLKQLTTSHTVILCPNFLNICNSSIENVHLGAQNVSMFDDGAHTGEISAEQLKSFKVEYCIVGHSERRKEQKESNEDVNLKIKKLSEQRITPILCVGETKEEREDGLANKIIMKELEAAFNELTEEEINQIIIAYEPIWSIGTGIIPTIDQIEEVFKMIKDKYPKNKVLYGGSANENNINELKKCSLIDGYLLGGISLKPDKLKEFVKKM